MYENVRFYRNRSTQTHVLWRSSCSVKKIWNLSKVRLWVLKLHSRDDDVVLSRFEKASTVAKSSFGGSRVAEESEKRYLVSYVWCAWNAGDATSNDRRMRRRDSEYFWRGQFPSLNVTSDSYTHCAIIIIGPPLLPLFTPFSFFFFISQATFGLDF